ncbi:MAG: hypothetical protein LAN84_01020 [Acidobacteriia bacterium]|nr:hypothetical protein [Terriglobia bacterium]
MRRLPLSLIERIFCLPFMRRPRFLALAAPESPSLEELRPNLMVLEIRGGYLKWAHLSCPKCGDHIQLPLVGTTRWSVKVDLLRRPTLAPSIWETESCGAHFFVEKGELLWCERLSSGENATLFGC